MYSTEYAVPYDPSMGIDRSPVVAESSRDSILPSLSLWMSRALRGVLAQADAADAMGNKDGVLTLSEIQSAYDAGLYEAEPEKYTIARLFDHSQEFDAVCQTAHADSANPGLLIEDLKQADLDGELVGNIRLEPAVINDMDREFAALVDPIMAAYKKFLQAA